MRNFTYIVLTTLIALCATVYGQETPAVKASDLKDAPQRYWAGFFVFTDVLTRIPDSRSVRVDDGDVFKFATSEVGDVYAEPAAAAILREASVGEEFLFFATVKQQKSGVWGRLRGGEFMVIVKEAAIAERDEEVIAGFLSGAGAEDGTNASARALFDLNEVSQAAQQELFGFAQSEGMTIEALLSSPEYQQKVASSIRNALRKYEQQSRSSSQELFVAVIRSVLASSGEGVNTSVAEPDYVPVEIESDAGMDVADVIDQSLTEALVASQAELERETAARAAAEARVVELQVRVDQLIAQMKAFSEEVPENGSPQPGLAVAFELANVELEQEMAARASAEARVVELQAQVDNLSSRVEELNDQAVTSNAELEARVADAWASARADLEKEITARAKAEARASDLLAQLDEIGIGSSRAITSEMNYELEAEIEAANERIAQLTAELEKLQRQDMSVQKLAVALDEARKRLSVETDTRTKMETRVAELQRALSEVNRPSVPALSVEAPRIIKRMNAGGTNQILDPKDTVPLLR